MAAADANVLASAGSSSSSGSGSGSAAEDGDSEPRNDDEPVHGSEGGTYDDPSCLSHHSSSASASSRSCFYSLTNFLDSDSTLGTGTPPDNVPSASDSVRHSSDSSTETKDKKNGGDVGVEDDTHRRDEL